MKKHCHVPLLIRGDVVSLELENGQMVEMPDDWGMIHDPTGRCLRRCDILLTSYSVETAGALRMHEEVIDEAVKYFGSRTKLHNASVVLIDAPWQRVGRVVRIYYRRYGEEKGYYQHPFESPYPALFERVDGNAYKLVLAKGCVINSHGFVYP